LFSILVPVYEVDVRSLVSALAVCGRNSLDDFQIIVLDDGSSAIIQELNRSISEEFNVSYITLSENIGRAKIRNRLAQLARYDNLIFLDCDSGEIPSDYLSKYCQALQQNDIVYGGRLYPRLAPQNCKLHHHYGLNREAKKATLRSKNSYLDFQSNNFAIKASTFAKIKFDETITGYGYEDLVFAEQAKNLNISISHIDNEIIHLILDSDDQFLSKIETSIINLSNLLSVGKLKNTRLSIFHKKLVWLLYLIPKSSKIKLQTSLKNKMKSSGLTSFYLDLYKLLLFDSKTSSPL
jgi:glycosyltransferase involved in cell wall biosynthesis